MSDKLMELARRVEKMSGPSLLIEQEIADAVGHNPRARLPNYTASLDASLTLVPDKWFWRVGHSTLYAGWAHLNRLHPDSCNREDEHSAQAATPALALCAAALRALASKGGAE